MDIKRTVLCVQFAVVKGSHLAKFYEKLKNTLNSYKFVDIKNEGIKEVEKKIQHLTLLLRYFKTLFPFVSNAKTFSALARKDFNFVFQKKLAHKNTTRVALCNLMVEFRSETPLEQERSVLSKSVIP
jgi:hypothetical protein